MIFLNLLILVIYVGAGIGFYRRLDGLIDPGFWRVVYAVFWPLSLIGLTAFVFITVSRK